jgi:hypothetical protein
MPTVFGHSWNLKPREKRALVVMAAAVTLFLLLEFAFLPWMEGTEKVRAGLPLKEKTLRKYQQMVALAADGKAEWRNLQTRLAEAEKGLLESRAPAVASAELQELVKQLMTEQGMEMRSADFRPVRALKPAAAGYSVVPLSLSFECTLDQLTNFLLLAQSNNKTLGLGQFSITAVPPRPKQPLKMVAVRMVIRGLMLAEPAPTPKS